MIPLCYTHVQASWRGREGQGEIYVMKTLFKSFLCIFFWPSHLILRGSMSLQMVWLHVFMESLLVFNTSYCTELIGDAFYGALGGSSQSCSVGQYWKFMCGDKTIQKTIFFDNKDFKRTFLIKISLRPENARCFCSSL